MCLNKNYYKNSPKIVLSIIQFHNVSTNTKKLLKMNSVKITILLAILGSAWAGVVEKKALENPLPFPHFEPEEIFTCGGVITEETEQILYKPFRQADPNERCVWIVAVPQASGYRFRLHHSGFDPNQGFLNVVGISQNSYALNNAYRLSTDWSSLSSNVLIVTFHTSNETSSGFALEYEVVARNNVVSPNSKHSIVDADTLFVKYPEGREYYDNYELTTFALPPFNNVQVEGHSRQVLYNRLGLEGCYDRVSVYEFNTATNRYDLKGSLCDNTPRKSEVISLRDTGLVVFRSDFSNVAAGFNLAFPHCSA